VLVLLYSNILAHNLFLLYNTDTDTQTWIITAITKLVSQMGNFSDEAQSHVACYLASVDIDMQQVGGGIIMIIYTTIHVCACMRNAKGVC